MMKEHIVYQKLETNNLPYLKSLIEVYEEVFEMENFTLPADGYLQALLHREGLMFFVATLEGNVVGGLTAHVLPSVYFESAEVYIYDLGVKTSFQRKGIGKNLMASLSEYCKKRGDREIFVQADLVDQHAMDFYQATGGQTERVVHYNYSLG
jgi:aminoglycoside 3-N-acetyltransferase I